jgi:MoxR-like ATPase
VQTSGQMSAAEASALAGRVLDEVERAVVGKREALMLVLAAVLAKGHVLLEDFPGLGKTLAARSFADALGLDFTRAQFTPDLLPADLTGSFLYDQRRGEFEFRRGPLFTGLLLADEINRTPPPVHRSAARRRDQPDAAQDPVRPARGDAGAPGDGGG